MPWPSQPRFGNIWWLFWDPILPSNNVIGSLGLSCGRVGLMIANLYSQIWEFHHQNMSTNVIRTFGWIQVGWSWGSQYCSVWRLCRRLGYWSAYPLTLYRVLPSFSFPWYLALNFIPALCLNCLVRVSIASNADGMLQLLRHSRNGVEGHRWVGW